MNAPGWLRRFAFHPAAAFRSRGWLLAMAAALLVGASLLPPLPRARPVFNHLVVFDVTQSMNVVDQTVNGRPASRLVAARAALSASLAALPCGSKLGIGIFSNRRTLLLISPIDVCDNTYELNQALDQIDSRMAWENASVISRGLYSAVDVALELPSHPTIAFISDGQEAPWRNDDAVPPFPHPPNKIHGTVLGIGSTTPQPIPRTDREGRMIGYWTANSVPQRSVPAGQPPSQEHLSALHEPHLQALANVSGLDYLRLDAPQGMRAALTNPALAIEQVVPTDMRWVPALLACLCLAGFYLPMPGRGWQASRLAAARGAARA